MRFEIVQAFTAPPEEVAAAYTDVDLYPTLVGLPKLGGIEVLNHDVDDAVARMRVRFRFTGDLPSAVTAVIDPTRLTWVQESIHELASGATRFRLLPDHYPDRLKASGTYLLEGAGSGTRRIVTGDLKVRAPLVAGRVEAAIVSGLEEYLIAEAPTVDTHLGY